MRHLVIDARFGGQFVGLGSFTKGLSIALASRHPSDVRITFLVSSMSEPWISALCGDDVATVEAPWKHYSWQEHVMIPRLLSRLKADFVLFPHFNAPLFCRVPMACIIHDLILHRYPGSVSLFRRLAYRCVFRSVTRRARWIFSPSHAVLQEIVSMYPSIRDRSSVLSPGLDSAFVSVSHSESMKVRSRYGLPERYFLYVGNRRVHKNVPVLLQAFTEANIPDTFLVLVTSPDPSLDADMPPRCRVVSDIAASDLPAVYAGARALVTASKAEGFCFPVVEAMRVGCPVICSDVPPFPEVTGGHATLVPPTPQEIARAMREILSSPMTASDRERAMLHTRRFDWQRTADALLATLSPLF